MGFLRNLFVDITPLKSNVRYRWLYAGLGVTWLGRQLTVVAVPYQIYQITGSTLAVGLLGMVQFVPTLFVSLAGGAVADAVDRRKLLALTQVGLAFTAVGLAWNAGLDAPMVWPLYVLSGVNASLSAIDLPTRAATLPALVGREHLPSALALNQTLGNVFKAVGPAVAGLLIAKTTLSLTYGAEFLAYLIGAVMIAQIGPLPPEDGGRRPGLRSIIEGLRFLRSRPVLQANFAIDLNAMVFGMPTALFPAIGTELLGGDATTVGLLYAAPGAGALVAAFTSGWVSRIRREGFAVVVSVIIWGVAIAAFGTASSTRLAVAMLAIAGGADVVSAVFRNTILQLSVPDSLRGRLSGIHVAVVAGGPRLGDLEAGAVATFTSLRFSVISGGVACVAGALAIARFMPRFVRYRTETMAADSMVIDEPDGDQPEDMPDASRESGA